MYNSINCEPCFMECNYSIVSESLYDTDLGKYESYGIQAKDSDCAITLHDVSTCKETALTLTELFNRYNLSPCHLWDAIGDMLP